MGILKVARMGHPVLRQPAEPVPDDAIGTPEMMAFLEDMLATMDDYGGVGLAAPQLHVSRRVVIVQYPWSGSATEAPSPIALINPEIVSHSNELVPGWEGCLSIPDIRGEVERWARIRVRAVSVAGEPMDFEADGFPARVIQHEVDHLDGVLFLDRMEDMEPLAFMDEYHRFWQRDEESGPEEGGGGEERES